jgi:hypothetical protein
VVIARQVFHGVSYPLSTDIGLRWGSAPSVAIAAGEAFAPRYRLSPSTSVVPQFLRFQSSVIFLILATLKGVRNGCWNLPKDYRLHWLRMAIAFVPPHMVNALWEPDIRKKGDNPDSGYLKLPPPLHSRQALAEMSPG